jgi:hypothetical protein
MAKVFTALGKTEGLKAIGIISNCLGAETYQTMAEKFIKVESFKNLRKFILKDPNPQKSYPLSVASVLSNLSDISTNLKCLRVLTLSKLGMDLKCIQCLGEAIISMPNLEQLDISANNLFS